MRTDASPASATRHAGPARGGVCLETDRLLLRRLTPNDAPALFRTVGDPAVMRYWIPGPDADVERARDRIADIEAHWDAHGFGDYAVVTKAGRRLIGFAGLHHIADMDEVNIGYALERTQWRHGLGEELCRRLTAFGVEVLGLPRIVAVIDPANIASLRLVERCGFTPWKRFEWAGHDRVAYSITP